MDSRTVQVVVATTGKVAVALIWGEILGSVISNPIKAWRSKPTANLDRVADLIDVMNQRICALEEKENGEAK